METEVDYLDCCSKPTLEAIKVIYESNHDMESVCQCNNCKAYWFYRFNEYVSYIADDDLTVWYSRLTDDEANNLINSSVRPDLSFLEHRASFMEDSRGVQQVSSQPSYPFS